MTIAAQCIKCGQIGNSCLCNLRKQEPKNDSQMDFKTCPHLDTHLRADGIKICSDCSAVVSQPASNAEGRERGFKLVGHGHQIADTGDYDGHWEITNGKMSILSREDDPEALEKVVDALNDSECDFYLDDADSYLAHHFEKEFKTAQEIIEARIAKSECPHCKSSNTRPINEKEDLCFNCGKSFEPITRLAETASEGDVSSKADFFANNVYPSVRNKDFSFEKTHFKKGFKYGYNSRPSNTETLKESVEVLEELKSEFGYYASTERNSSDQTILLKAESVISKLKAIIN